jgi:predicted lipoprotein with Yx(FWY)xxD motif
MRTFTLCCALAIAAFGIVACGGATSTTPVAAGATATPTLTPVTPPAASPTATAAAPTSATTLATMTLLGAPGFVAPSGRTAYVLSDDTTTSVACTVASGCISAWFPIAPPSGVALSTGFTTFTRPDDNSFVQLAYLGHPLYTFIDDTANGQTNGENIMNFGGTWTVAHP